MRACIGSKPCQEKKKAAQALGLRYQINSTVRMTTVNAVSVRAA